MPLVLLENYVLDVCVFSERASYANYCSRRCTRHKTPGPLLVQGQIATRLPGEPWMAFGNHNPSGPRTTPAPLLRFHGRRARSRAAEGSSRSRVE